VGVMNLAKTHRPQAITINGPLEGPR